MSHKLPKVTPCLLENCRCIIGPPVGGVLYGRFGYRAPLVFGELCTLFDLIGRLLIIERKEAVTWGVDLAALPEDERVEHLPSNTTGCLGQKLPPIATPSPELCLSLSIK